MSIAPEIRTLNAEEINMTDGSNLASDADYALGLIAGTGAAMQHRIYGFDDPVPAAM